MAELCRIEDTSKLLGHPSPHLAYPRIFGNLPSNFGVGEVVNRTVPERCGVVKCETAYLCELVAHLNSRDIENHNGNRNYDTAKADHGGGEK